LPPGRCVFVLAAQSVDRLQENAFTYDKQLLRVPEMKIQVTNWLRAAFFLGAIAFYYLVFFTSTGNFFHGGTVAESMLLQAITVATVAIALALVRRIRIPERILTVLLAAIPAAGVVLSIVSMISR
jgi:hypothetical protein